MSSLSAITFSIVSIGIVIHDKPRGKWSQLLNNPICFVTQIEYFHNDVKCLVLSERLVHI